MPPGQGPVLVTRTQYIATLGGSQDTGLTPNGCVSLLGRAIFPKAQLGWLTGIEALIGGIFGIVDPCPKRPPRSPLSGRFAPNLFGLTFWASVVYYGQ